MDLHDGRFTAGPETGRLLIRTGRSGLGAKAGHDLTLEATRWQADITLAGGDPAASSVTVSVDPESFEIRQATGGVKPLTDADRAEIQKNVREKILHTRSHPEITFRSTRIAGKAESFSVDGDLTLAGTTRPITVNARLEGDRVQGTATVVQSRWGIRPYSALFGALRLRDEVEIEFDLRLAATP
ncbi:YceI family protein [Nonomuraea sp. SYSU D8015]|uniref:YceI family protein n=1 Tax=Nonomuraea sp. SYSU D8015 TaxID=2593644 RepID=UPI00166086DD|nr:YceI family protein [Nonomuraea sp. SYSU D8015]